MRSTWFMAGVMFFALIASFRYSTKTALLPPSARESASGDSRLAGDAEQVRSRAGDSNPLPTTSARENVGQQSIAEMAHIASRWKITDDEAPVLEKAAAAEPEVQPAPSDEFGFALPPIAANLSPAAAVELSPNERVAGPELAALSVARSAALAGTLLAAPPAFLQTRIGSESFPIPGWSKHLAGIKIMLDPGHGGDADQPGFKRGPTGVREAEINLRLGLYLREFLEAAGANVRMTRESDCAVSLEDRAGMANDWPADIFVSLHHNAIEDRPDTNYSSVWYHADVDRNPANLDLSRYLADALHDALRLPQVNDVPIKSDFLMYPVGFAVLRHAKMPAALCECSFYSNPQEEQRLRDPEYVLREAHGVFLALARYSQAGIPRLKLLVPADGRVEKDDAPELVFELDDGLRKRRSWGWQRRMLLGDSILVRIDGLVVRHTLIESREGYRLRVSLPEELSNGSHQAEVQFQNMNKNSVINPRVEFEYEGGDKEVG